MKNFVSVICILMPVILSAQAQTYTVGGTLCDSIGNPVCGASAVVMTCKDSLTVKWDFIRENRFSIVYPNLSGEPMMLYISAYGFRGRFICLAANADQELGQIMLRPLQVDIGQVTVSADAMPVHTFNRGCDEFTIPAALGQREYDLYTLLSNIPGLDYDGRGITIVGTGAPTYTINGLKPRPGEIENINPRDIERIVINRMPTAKYDKSVVGIIDLRLRKSLKDNVSVRLKESFSYRTYPGNDASLSVNAKTGRWFNYLSYANTYSRSKYDLDHNVTIFSPEGEIHKRSDIHHSTLNRGNSINYSPKFQLNDHSFVDAQYSFSSNNRPSERERTCLEMAGVENNLAESVSNGRKNVHNVIIRYDNDLGNGGKITLNGGYSYFGQTGNTTNHETISYPDNTSTSAMTAYDREFTSKAATFTADCDFNIGNTMFSSLGGNFAHIWNKSNTNYAEGPDYLIHTRELQAAAYFTLGQNVGQFGYQIGIRGEYLRKQRVRDSDENEKPFTLLPSVSLSYKFSDHVNMTLYFRRFTTHPTLEELDPILTYVNKYEYLQGNPYLKPFITDDLSFRLSLPQNISIMAKYKHGRNTIVQAHLIDETDPKIMTLTYFNFPRSNLVEANISWNKTVGRYTIMVNGFYTQVFTRHIPYKNGTYASNKPRFGVTTQHMLTLTDNLRLLVYGAYQTSYDDIMNRQGAYYRVNASLTLSLLKRKLLIFVAGDNLIYSFFKQRSHYKGVRGDYTTHNYDRQLRIGITYNFNNFRDLFKKNDSNADILQRLE